MRCVEHAQRIGEINMYMRILPENIYEEKRHLGRPRRRIKDYVKMDSKENRG
jgi:hypothetical protein